MKALLRNGVLVGLAVIIAFTVFTGPRVEQGFSPELQTSAEPDPRPASKRLLTGPSNPPSEQLARTRFEESEDNPVEIATERQHGRKKLNPSLEADLAMIGPHTDFEEFLHLFALEAEDTSWARSTEAHLMDLLGRGGNLTAADIQIDCRTVTCRIRLTGAQFDPSGRLKGFFDFVDATGLQKAWEFTGLHDDFGNRVDFAYLRKPEVNGD